MLLTNSNIGSHPYNSIILYGVAIYIMSPEAGTYIKNIRSSHILCDPSFQIIQLASSLAFGIDTELTNQQVGSCSFDHL